MSGNLFPIGGSSSGSVGDWTSYTPTFTGFGTPSDVSFKYREVGGTLEIRGNFTSGVTTVTEGRISLPAGYTSGGAAVMPTIAVAGYLANTINAAAWFSVLIERSKTYMTFGKQDASNPSLTKIAPGNMTSNGNGMSLLASIPIS